MGDLHLALRSLFRSPAITIAAVLALALSLGAVVAAWAVLSATVIRPLPVPDADGLVVFAAETGGRSRETFTVAEYEGLVRTSTDFDGVVAAGYLHLSVEGGTADLLVSPVAFVTHDFVSVLGLIPEIGRSFLPNEDQLDSSPVVLLANEFWRRSYGGDPSVVGRQVRIGTGQATVIGVLPRGFHGTRLTDVPAVYVPLRVVERLAGQDSNYLSVPWGPESPLAWLMVLARVKAGRPALVSIATANLSGSAESIGMLRAFPAATGVVPFAGREQARTFGRLVALVMAVLLSAGLTSVATLLLVKIEARTEEFALRRALGATRARLVRLVSVEALVLAVVAVAVAVPIGQLFLLWVNQFELPFGIALRTLDLRVGYGSVLFGLAGGASVAVLIALAASVGGTMTHLVTLRPSAPKPRYRNRRLIVGAIAGLTVLALGGTGLFVRSLLAATSFEAGYLPDGLVTAQFDLRPYGYDGARSAIFMNRLMDHARGRLGALQVSTAVYAGGIGSHGDLYLDGQPVRSPGNVRYVAVDATYFATLGMPVRGRDFGRADARGTPLVSILSRSLARHLAAAEPEESVLGRELRFSFGRVRIVGIVPDVLRGVQDQRSFTLYLAYEQHAHRLGWIRQLVVRSTHTEQAKRDILRAIASVDSRVVPTSLTADNEQFESQLGIQRLAVGVLGGLSIVLLALTVVAVYVAVSTTLMARRREFAIRWALGAGRGSVVWTVTGEILVTVAGGALAGMVLLWLGSQVIGSLLIGVSAGDPLTLITTAGFVLAVALLAAGVPVAWVSRREPWAALKES